jgi:hypothetical protein
MVDLPLGWIWVTDMYLWRSTLIFAFNIYTHWTQPDIGCVPQRKPIYRIQYIFYVEHLPSFIQ